MSKFPLQLDGRRSFIPARQNHDSDSGCAGSKGASGGFGESLRNLAQKVDTRPDFERFFNLIPDLACIVSTDGFFKKVNPAWEIALGFTTEEVIKIPMLELIHPDDLERTILEVAKQSPQYRTRQFVNRYRCKDGSYRVFEWATTFNRDDSTRFGVARDVTDLRLAESVAQGMAQQIARAAHYDFLTDLPNRKHLNDRINQTIDSARRHLKKVAVLFLDLDGFKQINDTLSHAVGDKLLQSVAKTPRRRGVQFEPRKPIWRR